MSEDQCLSERDNFFATQKHKIELCRSFAELGFCHYGESCIFAHGIEQLLMYQPALKIKKCRNYHTYGYCKFGERCNFRHEKNLKPRKKKNQYKFHKMLNNYPELILFSMTDSKSCSNSLSRSSSSSLSCL